MKSRIWRAIVALALLALVLPQFELPAAQAQSSALSNAAKLRNWVVVADPAYAGGAKGGGADDTAAFLAAIAALPSTGGIVDASALRGDSNITSTLTLGSATKPVVLLLGAGRIISQANPVISCPSGGSGSALRGHTSGATSIVYNGTNNDGIVWECSYGFVSDITLSAGSSARHGLVLKASGTNGVQANAFNRIRMAGPSSAAGSIGLRLIGDSASAISTLNQFNQLKIWDYDTNVKLETSGSQGPTDNFFYALHIGSSTGTGTRGIDIASGALNNFYGAFVAGKALGVAVAGQYNGFFGLRTESNTTNLNDGGTGTMFYGLSTDTATTTFASTAIVDGFGNVGRSLNQRSRLDSQWFLSPITGNAAFQTLFTYTLPANTLGSNGCLRVSVGYLHGTGAASVSYKLTFGGTTVFSFNDAGVGSSTFETVVCNRASTASQGAFTSGAAVDGATLIGTGHATAAIDTTSSVAVKFEFSVAATDAVTPRTWLVELVQ